MASAEKQTTNITLMLACLALAGHAWHVQALRAASQGGPLSDNQIAVEKDYISLDFDSQDRAIAPDGPNSLTGLASLLLAFNVAAARNSVSAITGCQGMLMDPVVPRSISYQKRNSPVKFLGDHDLSSLYSTALVNNSRLNPAMTTKIATQDSIVSVASALLAKFDKEQRAAAASQGSEGLGGGITASKFAARSPKQPLADAVVILSKVAKKQHIGICANDLAQGMQVLKTWVARLGLPFGLLYGMNEDGSIWSSNDLDEAGIPLDLSTCGAVYIKYCSEPSAERPAGRTLISKYEDDFRGVYFNPSLGDGMMRLYGVLPLDLFGTDGPDIDYSGLQPR